MDNEHNEYGENPVEDMMTDYDYHINTGELPVLFDEASVDDYIASLNDWDWNMIYYDCGIDKAVIIKLQT